VVGDTASRIGGGGGALSHDSLLPLEEKAGRIQAIPPPRRLSARPRRIRFSSASDAPAITPPNAFSSTVAAAVAGHRGSSRRHGGDDRGCAVRSAPGDWGVHLGG